MNRRLKALFDVIDKHTGFVPLDELVDEMTAADIDIDDVAAFIHFNDDDYCRNLVRKTDAYEALVLCWNPGQRSPIHDHVGSRCGLRVLKGRAVEQVYDHDDRGRLVSTVRHEYPQGCVCGSQDRDIHEIINENDGELITLHIYTPPLGDINIYDCVRQTVCSVQAPVHVPAGAGIE